MKSSGKGGGAVKLDRNNPVDTATYGQAASAETFQPFWDAVFQTTDDQGNITYAGIDGDLYGSDPWDVVKLQGIALPGIWKATATPSIVLDVQKPNGFDGAALVSRGYSPGRITITGRLWTPEQWEEFQRYLPMFWTRPNTYAVNDRKRQTGQIQGSQRAIEVEYPGLAAVGIHALVIQQISPPEETGEKGVREIKMMAIEYVPEPQKKKAATKKTDGVASGKDRSVQAQRIAAQKAATPSGEGGAKMPASVDEPVPPSLGQAGAKLPKRPAYASH